jgi:hypothetical protein
VLRNISRKNTPFLGFSRWRLFIGRGAMPEGGQGPHTIGWRAQGSTRATT